MNYAILDPSILYINEVDWADEFKRDSYLEHFMNVLNGIHYLENIVLAWSFSFESVMWSDPQRYPWNRDKCWSNTMVPILYERINKKAKFFDINEDQFQCDIQPEIYCERTDFYVLFIKLIASLHNNCNKILICFSLKNIPPQEHIFSVNNENLVPNPIFITDIKGFLDQIDVSMNYWPNCTEDNILLKKGIAIILKREYGKEISENTYNFSKSFLKKLNEVTDDKDKILDTIAKRLSMSKAEAGKNGALQEEYVKGKRGVRRFRISDSKRIHYSESKGAIEFLMYFDDGEHDVGL